MVSFIVVVIAYKAIFEGFDMTIEATAIAFESENYVLYDDGIIKILPTPEDTTQSKIVLTFENGKGDDILELPIQEGETQCIVEAGKDITIPTEKQRAPARRLCPGCPEKEKEYDSG